MPRRGNNVAAAALIVPAAGPAVFTTATNIAGRGARILLAPRRGWIPIEG